MSLVRRSDIFPGLHQTPIIGLVFPCFHIRIVVTIGKTQCARLKPKERTKEGKDKSAIVIGPKRSRICKKSGLVSYSC